MILRPAEARDASEVAAIWNPVIRETAATFTTQEKTPEGLAADFAVRAAEGKLFLVAEDAGALLGFATYVQFRNGPGYARTMEHSIILASAARGRGVGRALMAALEDHARAGGVHSLLGWGQCRKSGRCRVSPCHRFCRDRASARGGIQIRALDGSCADAENPVILAAFGADSRTGTR